MSPEQMQAELERLEARVAELTADAEFLTTPERLAEIIDAKNARIAELEALVRRLLADAATKR